MANVDERKTDMKDDGPKADSEKVAFTPEQQSRVQELIDDAYKKAFRKASRSSSSAPELDELRKEVERLKGDKLMASVFRAVARHNVVDAEEVAELISRRVALDASGRAVATESPKTDIDDYVHGWLTERPHHLRASFLPGAGSSGARYEGKGRPNLSDPFVWRNMPREDVDRLLKEGVDVHGGGQVFKFKNVGNPFLEARKRRFKTGG